MNIYFEVSDSPLKRFGGHKYRVYSGTTINGILVKTFNLSTISDRVWVEDEDSVHYWKHPNGYISTAVDMKEFMLVKLRSHYYGR